MLFDDVRRFTWTAQALAQEITTASPRPPVGCLLDDIRRRRSGVGARVLEVRDRLRRMVADLRIIFDLRTGVDDMTGLGTAYEYVQRVGSQPAWPSTCRWRSPPIGCRSPRSSCCGWSEAVTNVRKHAAARTCSSRWRSAPRAQITLANAVAACSAPGPTAWA